MKGFVITILTMGFITILISFSIILHNNYLALERGVAEPLPLLYSSSTSDSVAYGLNQLLGPQISFVENNTSITMAFTDQLGSLNYSQALSSYESFIEQNLSNETHSSISLNLSNISNRTVRMYIDGNYVYAHDSGQQPKINFTASVPGTATGASEYDMNFSIAKTRASVSHFSFNGSGDMNITIVYSDNNGTGTESGTLFSNGANAFSISYTDGSAITINAGSLNGNGGSISIASSGGVSAPVSWRVVLPALGYNKTRGYEYDATISYVQGKVSKSRRIGR